MSAVFWFLLVLVFDALSVGILPRLLRRAVQYTLAPSTGRLPARPTKRLNIAIVTHYSDQQVQSLTRPNLHNYCKRHNYDLIVLNDYKDYVKVSGFGRRPFGAIKTVMQAPSFLDYKLYDWIMWVDSDTVFLNHGIRMESIIDLRYSFIISSPLEEAVPSPSHFLVRNSQEGIEILQDLQKLSDEHCGQFILDHPGAGTALNGWLHVCNSDGTFWNGDSGLLLAILTFRPAEYRCRFKRIGHRIMDSQFPSFADGDLAVSFPDHTADNKRTLIRLLLENADHKRGIVKRPSNGQLDSVDPGLGDWRSLEALHDAHLNVPCEDL